MVAMKEHLKQRLSDGDKAEVDGKKQAEEDAKTYLQVDTAHRVACLQSACGLRNSTALVVWAMMQHAVIRIRSVFRYLTFCH